MNKNNSHKKNTVEQLYKTLNHDYKKGQFSEEENYLKSLSIRLKSTEKEIKQKKRGNEELKRKGEDFLKPKVSIHLRKKEKTEKIEFKKEEPKEKTYEKDLFELEKVEILEPKFIQVKPKVITKPKNGKIPEEELVEWEEVDILSAEPEKIKEEISEKVTTEPVEFIEKTEDEIFEEKKEEIPIDKKLTTEEFYLDLDKKIEVFKDYKTIDQETAILLYDNGYTNTDSLKKATIKDLRKIKGIKRKTAKKIKKEIEEKLKQESIEISKEEVEIKEEKPEEPEKEIFLPEEEIKYSEWEPIESKKPDEELQTKIEESIEEQNKKIEVFKDYKTIDQETAILLYDNGYTNTDSLKKATIKDLRKIKGIKRKTAKKIKKEIEEKLQIEGRIEEELKGLKTTKKYEEEEVFKDIKSIDDKIAKLLMENGVNSIDSIKKMSIKDLTAIKGIKKRIAKKIKKEVTKLSRETVQEFIPELIKPKKQIGKKVKSKKTVGEKKIPQKSKKEIKSYMHKGYILYEKKIKTPSGNKKIFRFFSKTKPKTAKPIELPKGFKVLINKKTGVPYIKKKK